MADNIKPEKRFENAQGHYFTQKRADLVTASRSELKAYLEARGTAVFAEESTELLRECALQDYDGER